jgi:hypothetical protein
MMVRMSGYASTKPGGTAGNILSQQTLLGQFFYAPWFEKGAKK